MRSDLIGRRAAVEQRLQLVQTLALTLNEKTAILADASGLSIEELDPEGSLRAALTAVAGVAARRPHFDVIVTLPDAPFALRIQNLDDEVSAEVVVPRDGPYESAPAPEPAPRPSAWGAPAGNQPGSVQVASDLAALLWQGVADESA
jgi:hypothetical protein